MNPNDADETRLFWNRVADDWDTQVGDEGDRDWIDVRDLFMGGS
jgi:hypothetical protein